MRNTRCDHMSKSKHPIMWWMCMNRDESRDEISGQNTTEYFNLAHQSCKNATLCNFAHFKCTYIKAAAQLKDKNVSLWSNIWRYFSCKTRNIKCPYTWTKYSVSVAGSRHELQGRWGVGPGPFRAMPKSYLYLLHKQRTLLTLRCPCKDKKVLEKH